MFCTAVTFIAVAEMVAGEDGLSTRALEGSTEREQFVARRRGRPARPAVAEEVPEPARRVPARSASRVAASEVAAVAEAPARRTTRAARSSTKT